MNHQERLRLAEKMTQSGDQLRERLSAVLQEMGFENLEITEFDVAPRGEMPAMSKGSDLLDAEAFSTGTAPCTTECIVTPSGVIRCFTRC
jgi:hypothetical protein